VAIDNVQMFQPLGTGSLPMATDVNLSGGLGATLDLSGATQTIGSLAGADGSSVINNGSLTTGVHGLSTSFAGVISGAGSFTKTGAGMQTLSGANTYSGNTTISAGTLVIAQATLATSSTVSIANGGVLSLGFSTTNVVAGLITNGVSLAPGVYNSANLPFITGAGALEVAGSAGPSGPAELTNRISGSTLSLNWPAGQGWKLQQQTNALSTGLSTNWSYITDGSVSSTNITVDVTKPAVFYRLRYP